MISSLLPLFQQPARGRKVAESDIQQALDEVLEFIRALPVDSYGYDDLSMCQEVVSQMVREAVPAFGLDWLGWRLFRFPPAMLGVQFRPSLAFHFASVD